MTSSRNNRSSVFISRGHGQWVNSICDVNDSGYRGNEILSGIPESSLHKLPQNINMPHTLPILSYPLSSTVHQQWVSFVQSHCNFKFVFKTSCGVLTHSDVYYLNYSHGKMHVWTKNICPMCLTDVFWLTRLNKVFAIFE